MTLTHTRAATLAVFASLVAASHAVGIDGTAEATYGPALFNQNVGTGYGNSTNGSPVVATGSELDGVYGFQDATSLNAVITGNLESNFNHLVLFFDTGVGGVNTIGADNASSADFGYLNSLAGNTFDAGFNASYALWVRGAGGDAGNTVYVTLASLGAGGGDLFDINGTGSDTTTIRTASTTGFSFALNNVNVAGVDGSSGGASSGAGVTTGFEFSILRSLLGDPTGDVRMAGFITGGNSLSNQVIGGLPVGTGNLGNGGTDFTRFAGDQFVTIAAPVPEPGTWAALGLGAAALLRCRRR